MKRYKAFLASSEDLAKERKVIVQTISRLNSQWTKKDVYIELVDWEDMLHSFRSERIQDHFNREMLKCDIVIVLLFKRVGRFVSPNINTKGVSSDHITT